MTRRAIRRVLGGAVLAALAACVAANDLAPDLLLEAGHYKRLRAGAEQRIQANPQDAVANYHLGYVKFQQDDLDAALPLAEKAASLDPRQGDYRYLIAMTYGRKAEQASWLRALGHARRYKQEAEATIAINSLHIEARLGLMEYHLRAPRIAGGDKKKADQYINEIMRIDPARGYLAQARKAVIEKQTAQLEALYLKAMEANPKNYAVHITLAGYYGNALQKYDHAEKHAREAMKVDPGRVSAYSTLAGLYAAQTRWQDLDAMIPQAEKAVPDNLAPYFTAGRVLSNSGKDNARAERYLQKYLSQEPEIRGPSHALAHWRLGIVYEKMGRKPDAVREIETAIRMNPELEDAKKDLKRLK